MKVTSAWTCVEFSVVEKFAGITPAF